MVISKYILNLLWLEYTIGVLQSTILLACKTVQALSEAQPERIRLACSLDLQIIYITWLHNTKDTFYSLCGPLGHCHCPHEGEVCRLAAERFVRLFHFPMRGIVLSFRDGGSVARGSTPAF